MENQNTSFTYKQLAVNCFNRVWDLLDKKERTEADAEEMVHLCHASFWNWTQVEEHTPQNISVGYWQLARVYAEIENGTEALYYAKRCLTVSLDSELAPFFVAYGYEALARAYMLLNQVANSEQSLALALENTELIVDKASKKLVVVDLENIS
ncbi:hypothetical protein RJD24_19995 [Bacillaceae bacterium IKA-2]|nr:hypothetical protein RJD24_19995 [Bacillaceae bacterium IKA-2]